MRWTLIVENPDRTHVAKHSFTCKRRESGEKFADTEAAIDPSLICILTNHKSGGVSHCRVNGKWRPRNPEDYGAMARPRDPVAAARFSADVATMVNRIQSTEIDAFTGEETPFAAN